MLASSRLRAHEKERRHQSCSGAGRCHNSLLRGRSDVGISPAWAATKGPGRPKCPRLLINFTKGCCSGPRCPLDGTRMHFSSQRREPRGTPGTLGPHPPTGSTTSEIWPKSFRLGLYFVSSRTASFAGICGASFSRNVPILAYFAARPRKTFDVEDAFGFGDVPCCLLWA